MLKNLGINFSFRIWTSGTFLLPNICAIKIRNKNIYHGLNLTLNMNTSWYLVTGGRICATCFTRMLSSRDNLLFLWVALLALAAGDSFELKIISADFEAGCSPPFEAHLFSTYLKDFKQVHDTRIWEIWCKFNLLVSSDVMHKNPLKVLLGTNEFLNSISISVKIWR